MSVPTPRSRRRSPTGWFGWLDLVAVAEAAALFAPAIPFAFVVGLAITESNLPLGVAWSTSPLIFAGAAQLAVITLAGSASVWAVKPTWACSAEVSFM